MVMSKIVTDQPFRGAIRKPAPPAARARFFTWFDYLARLNFLSFTTRTTKLERARRFLSVKLTGPEMPLNSLVALRAAATAFLSVEPARLMESANRFIAS